MKLQAFKHSILWVFLLGITIGYSQQSDKKVEKFKVDANPTLEIDASHTDVTIESWNKNEILVEAAGVNAISFWQAIGLFALFRILFGGFRFGRRQKHWGGRKRRHKMREKWMNMSEEERAAFKDNWKEWCRKKD